MDTDKTIYRSADPAVIAWHDAVLAEDKRVGELIREFVARHFDHPWPARMAAADYRGRLPVRTMRVGWGSAIADVDRYSLRDASQWLKRDWTYPRATAPQELKTEWGALRTAKIPCPGMIATTVVLSHPGLRVADGAVFVIWGKYPPDPEQVGDQWEKVKASTFHLAVEADYERRDKENG